MPRPCALYSRSRGSDHSENKNTLFSCPRLGMWVFFGYESFLGFARAALKCSNDLTHWCAISLEFYFKAVKSEKPAFATLWILPLTATRYLNHPTCGVITDQSWGVFCWVRNSKGRLRNVWDICFVWRPTNKYIQDNVSRSYQSLSCRGSDMWVFLDSARRLFVRSRNLRIGINIPQVSMFTDWPLSLVMPTPHEMCSNQCIKMRSEKTRAFQIFFTTAKTMMNDCFLFWWHRIILHLPQCGCHGCRVTFIRFVRSQMSHDVKYSSEAVSKFEAFAFYSENKQENR